MSTKPNIDMKEILSQLKALEQLIKKIPPLKHCRYCVDFSVLPQVTLPNPFTVNLMACTLTFSTTSPQGLEIKPNPPQNMLGLRIPSDLTITITPTASVIATVELEVSSYASLSWTALSTAGGIVNSVPPSPAPPNIASHAVKINGAIAKIEFVGNNEESLMQICCF